MDFRKEQRQYSGSYDWRVVFLRTSPSHSEQHSRSTDCRLCTGHAYPPARMREGATHQRDRGPRRRDCRSHPGRRGNAIVNTERASSTVGPICLPGHVTAKPRGFSHAPVITHVFPEECTPVARQRPIHSAPSGKDSRESIMACRSLAGGIDERIPTSIEHRPRTVAGGTGSCFRGRVCRRGPGGARRSADRSAATDRRHFASTWGGEPEPQPSSRAARRLCTNGS